MTTHGGMVGGFDPTASEQASPRLVALDGEGARTGHGPRPGSKIQADIVRMALAYDEFELDFQPIVDLRSGTTIAAEALARWNRPGLGRLSPGDFIEMVTASGVGHDFDLWALSRAASSAKSWERLSSSTIPAVTVNLPPKFFATSSAADDVFSVLADAHLDPERLIIEITESFMLDHEAVAPRIDKLVSAGVRVAIDDFGTGFSNLSYLHRVPAGIVKLDKQFCAPVGIDPVGQRLTSGVVGLLRDLGFLIIAEGIEREAQAEFVAKLGCDLGQGYFFSRPIPHPVEAFP